MLAMQSDSLATIPTLVYQKDHNIRIETVKEDS